TPRAAEQPEPAADQQQHEQQSDENRHHARARVRLWFHRQRAGSDLIAKPAWQFAGHWPGGRRSTRVSRRAGIGPAARGDCGDGLPAAHAELGFVRERRAAEGTKHVDQNPRMEPPPPPLSPMVNDLRTLYSPQRRLSSLSAAAYFSSRSRPTVLSIRCRPA